MQRAQPRPIPAHAPLARAAWLFPIGLSLHNLEEAIWLPAWSQQAHGLQPVVQAGEFRFAVLVLTLAGFLITAAAVRSGRWRAASAYWSAMLLNVMFPHVLATILLRRYAPGTATALAINLPVCTYLLRRVQREGYLSRAQLLKAAALGVPLLLASLPVLFAVARWWTVHAPGLELGG